MISRVIHPADRVKVIFICHDRIDSYIEYIASRVILSNCSLTFNSKLQGLKKDVCICDMSDQENVTRIIFMKFLKFMHGENIFITKEQKRPLSILAEEYEVPSLKERLNRRPLNDSVRGRKLI